MAASFQERSRGETPSGRFSIDGAEYVRTYDLDEMFADGSSHAPRTDELTTFITQLIGGTNPGPSPRPLGAPGGAGSLDRIMPTCDSMFPGLFCESVSVSIDGMEGYRTGLPEPRQLAVPPTLGFGIFNNYKVVAKYQPRPYAVLPNERMVMAGPTTFYAEDGAAKLLRYYPEYVRYLQTLVDDMDSRVSATVGSAMEFRIPSGTPAGIDGSMYNAIPDMVIPDQAVKMRLFQVPLRYLTSPNSYLVRYKAFINQWPFLGRPIGSMLYMGAKSIKTYTPPQFDYRSQAGVIDGFVNILQGSYYAEPLVDLELSFIYTARTRPDADAIDPAERPNPNWIDGGHNLLPCFFTKRFHYAHAKTDPPLDTARWTPQYLSVPCQILFQDPDVAGLVT